MNVWNVEFIIEEIRSQERVGYRREIVKKKTSVNVEVENTDLYIILQCNASAKSKFSFELLFEEDRKNILQDEISEKMLVEYYVSESELNFTKRTGIIHLCYPKVNIL